MLLLTLGPMLSVPGGREGSVAVCARKQRDRRMHAEGGRVQAHTARGGVSSPHDNYRTVIISHKAYTENPYTTDPTITGSW